MSAGIGCRNGGCCLPLLCSLTGYILLPLPRMRTRMNAGEATQSPFVKNIIQDKRLIVIVFSI